MKPKRPAISTTSSNVGQALRMPVLRAGSRQTPLDASQIPPKLSIPALRPMPYLKDFNYRLMNPVDGYIGRPRNNQFAGSLFASRATAVRKSGKLLNALKNNPNRSKGRFGTVPGDVEADNFEIGTGSGVQRISIRKSAAAQCAP